MNHNHNHRSRRDGGKNNNNDNSNNNNNNDDNNGNHHDVVANDRAIAQLLANEEQNFADEVLATRMAASSMLGRPIPCVRGHIVGTTNDDHNNNNNNNNFDSTPILNNDNNNNNNYTTPRTPRTPRTTTPRSGNKNSNNNNGQSYPGQRRQHQYNGHAAGRSQPPPSSSSLDSFHNPYEVGNNNYASGGGRRPITHQPPQSFSNDFFGGGGGNGNGNHAPARLPAHMCVVPCVIGDNVCVEMMVDTGAQSSVISAPLVQKLGIESSKLDRSECGIAAGVGRANIVGKLRNVLCEFGHVEFAIDFIVLDISDPILLLGLDQMRKYKCIVDLEREKLIFGGAGGVEVPFLPSNDDDERRRRGSRSSSTRNNNHHNHNPFRNPNCPVS